MNVDRVAVSLRFALEMKFLAIFAVLIGGSIAATRPGDYVRPVTFRGNPSSARFTGIQVAKQNQPSPQTRAFATSSNSGFFNSRPPPSQPQISQGRFSSSGDATILNRNFHNTGSNYQWDFETSDGIKRSEQGEMQKIGENEGIVMRGEYSYVGPDGNTYKVTYVADRNGFRPSGSHLVGVPTH